MTILGKMLPLAVLFMLWPVAVGAAPQCNERQIVLDLLKQKYDEEPTSTGVANNGGLVEVFTSPSGETWSIILTNPKGYSCLVAAGEGWQQREMRYGLDEPKI